MLRWGLEMKTGIKEPNAVVVTLFYKDVSGQEFIGYIIRNSLSEVTELGLNLKDKMAKRGYTVTHHYVDHVYLKQVKHTTFDEWIQNMNESFT